MKWDRHPQMKLMKRIGTLRFGRTLPATALFLLSLACAADRRAESSAHEARAVVEFGIASDAATPVPGSGLVADFRGKQVVLEQMRHFDIESTSLTQDPLGWPAVGFEIRSSEKEEFRRWTAENVHLDLAVVIDGSVVMIATLQDPLPGIGMISLGDEPSEKDARELAQRIAPMR
jgi:preprotein translocase subunit SecD